MLYLAAQVARDRKERGLKLNYPEAVAFIAAALVEDARDGKSVSETMSHGAEILTQDDVMEGVPEEDLQKLHAGTRPCQAVWTFSRDNEEILSSQRLMASSDAKVAYGTDRGKFPFSHGILEFQAMWTRGRARSAP